MILACEILPHGHQSLTLSLQLGGVVRERIDGREFECLPANGTFKPSQTKHANQVSLRGGWSFIVECEDREIDGRCA